MCTNNCAVVINVSKYVCTVIFVQICLRGVSFYSNPHILFSDDGTEDNEGVSNSVARQHLYVCRAKINGILVAGQVRPSKSECVVSLHEKVHSFGRYELLINKEDSARLSWVSRSKFNLDPPGAVTGGNVPFLNFIARRKVKPDEIKEGGFTYLMGKFDPSNNLGVYTLVNEAGTEVEFEDGEILVETEPIRYELSSIKFDKFRERISREPRVLGQSVLKNEDQSTEEEVSTVETVISYNYTYSLNWGNGHGMLIGMNFSVNLENGSVVSGRWGLSDTFVKVDIKPVETFLTPGTARNVTLRGDYVQVDTPYTATLISYYKDGETRKRVLKDSQRESTMRNVLPDWGPVYFLHNNSFVPTTTSTTSTSTSTTSTTSTTTKATTTTTEEARPITPPDLEQPANNKNIDDAGNAPNKQANSSIQSDDSDALSLKKKDETKSLQSPGGASATIPNVAAVLLFLLLSRRFT